MTENNNSNINHFVENGFVVLKGLLNKDDLNPVIDEYTILLDQIVHKWFKEGKIKNLYANQSFEDRLISVSKEVGDDFYQPMDISLPPKSIFADTPMHCGQAIFNLLINPKLLAAVEMFIGSEIYSNPVQHVRLKVPEKNLDNFDLTSSKAGIQQTYWHQDQGVINKEADNSNILTVWIAMTESTPENGCLRVIPKSHKSGLTYHCFTKTNTGIPDNLLKEPLLLPMEPGDVLFLTKLTEHSSIPNKSDKIRWSFDLRYNPIGEPTGRDYFPGFVAKSSENPKSELKDYKIWEESWKTARKKVAKAYASESKPKFHRWDPNDPVCA